MTIYAPYLPGSLEPPKLDSSSPGLPRIPLVPDKRGYGPAHSSLSIIRTNVPHPDASTPVLDGMVNKQPDNESQWQETVKSFKRLNRMDAQLGNEEDANTWFETWWRMERCQRRDDFVDEKLRSHARGTRHRCRSKFCPYCSTTRAASNGHKVLDRLIEVGHLGVDWTVVYLTLTQCDSKYRSLKNAYDALHTRLSDTRNLDPWRNLVRGELTSIDIKRADGLRGGPWHAHSHSLILVPTPQLYSVKDLINAWLSLDGDIDVDAQRLVNVGRLLDLPLEHMRLNETIGKLLRYIMKGPQMVYARGRDNRWHRRYYKDIDRDFQEASVALYNSRPLHKSGVFHAGNFRRLRKSGDLSA